MSVVAGSAAGADSHRSATDDVLPWWLLAVVAGATLAAPVVAWAAREWRAGAATGLAAAAVGMMLPWWSGWSSIPASVGARALAAAPLAVGGTVHLAIRASSSTRNCALAAVHTLCFAAAVVVLVAYDPFHDPSCVRTCEQAGPVLGSGTASTSALATAELLVVAAAVIGVAVVVHGGLLVTAQPVVAAATCSTVLLVGSRYVRFNDWPAIARDPLPYLMLAGALVLPLLAVGAMTIRTKRTRGALDRLLAQLGESEPLTDRRHRAVVAVQVAVPEDGRWLDLDGAAVPDPSGGSHLVDLPSAPGDPLLRLVIPAGVVPADLVDQLTPARRLALSSMGLAAVTRAHTTAVRESQQRVVATGDAERRRIERDLHDGAQQRLVSVSLHLSSARSRVEPAQARALHLAGEQVRQVLDQLRRASHGSFPPVLMEEGLPAALEELVGQSDVAVGLDVRLEDGPVDEAAALASYAAIDAALHGLAPLPGVTAHVSVTGEHDALSITICAGGAGVTARHLESVDAADRVGALGGRYESGGGEGEAWLVVEIPCGS